VRGTWLKTFCSFHGQQQLLSSFIHLMMERPSSFYGRATRVTPRLYGGLVLFFSFPFFFFHFACHTLTRAFISALCKFIHISFGTSIVQSIHPPQKAFQQNITFLYSGASMFYAVVQILRIQPGDPQ